MALLDLEIVLRHQDRRRRSGQRQKLEKAREAVDDEAAVEGDELAGGQQRDDHAGHDQQQDGCAVDALDRPLVAEGADLLDVGGESSRPGAASVTAEEELARILPVLASTWVSLFKDTSLVSVIAVTELAYAAMQIRAQTFRVLEMLTAMAAIYWLLGYPQAKLVDWIQRRYAVTE